MQCFPLGSTEDVSLSCDHGLKLGSGGEETRGNNTKASLALPLRLQILLVAQKQNRSFHMTCSQTKVAMGLTQGEGGAVLKAETGAVPYA